MTKRMMKRYCTLLASLVLAVATIGPARGDDLMEPEALAAYREAVLTLARSPRLPERQQIAPLVAGFEGAEADAILDDLLRSEHPPLAAQAVKGLVHRRGDDTIARATALAGSDHAAVRRAAVRVLLTIGRAQSIGVFVEGMEDSDPVVRELSTMGLAATPSERGDALLRDRLTTGRVEGVLQILRAMAVAGVGRFDGLLESLAADDRYAVRGLAVAALGTVPEERRSAIEPTVRKALDDSHPYVRRMAAWSVFELKADGALDDLVVRLKDDDAAVREATAELLGRIDTDASRQALYERLDDPMLHVRVAAVRSMAGLLSPETKALNRRLLEHDLTISVPAGADSDSAAFRRMNMATRLLGLAHYGPAIERLKTMAREHANAKIRAAALFALTELCMPDPKGRGWARAESETVARLCNGMIGRGSLEVQSAAIAGVARLLYMPALGKLNSIAGNDFHPMMVQASIAVQYITQEGKGMDIQGFEEDYTGFPQLTHVWIPGRSTLPEAPSREAFELRLRRTLDVDWRNR